MSSTPDLSSFEDLPGAELIQRSFLFRDLNFDETSRLKQICRFQSCAVDEVIIEEDGLGQALYIVLEGWVGVRQESLGRDLTRLGPGQIFGEMSLVDDLLTSATVRAATACRLLVLPKRPFQALLDADPRLASKVYRAFCRVLSRRLRRAQASPPEAAGQRAVETAGDTATG